MTGIMGSIGNDNEPYALVMGIIAILTSVLFFLVYFNIFHLNLPLNISDRMYLYFFAGFTLLSGIVHLLTTLGFIGTTN